MKKTMRHIVPVLAGAAVLTAVPVTAWAAGWQQGSGQDAGKWFYTDAAGVRYANSWKWLDGNQDGTAECYCFDGNGWMYANTTTPDGYTVNENGAWTVNGAVQTIPFGASSGGASAPAQTAGTWKQNEAGRWYFENADGTRRTSGWHWLDGNQDGTAECYYFDAEGWMAANTTTPDGYTVNENGAWTENGAVQTRQTGVSGPGGSSSSTVRKSSGGGGGGGGSSSGGGGGSSSGGSGGSSNQYEEDDLWADYDDSSVSYSANDFETGNYGMMTASQRAEVADAIEAFKEEYGLDEMDDFAKELTIVQWLVENCVYGTGENWENSTAYSCIINGEAQCAGYADAFLQTAKACGLDVRYVYNTTHAWNLVKIHGRWYHVDVTWEDPVGSNNYGFGDLRNKYINLTDGQIRKIRSHNTWSPKSISCTGTEYTGTVTQYYMNTGIVDPEMKDDKWRLYLMKNEGADAGDYSLAAVGYKLDDGSNYFTGQDMEDKILTYLDTELKDGAHSVYLTFPDTADLSWLNASWMIEHLGGGRQSWWLRKPTAKDGIRPVIVELDEDETYVSQEESARLLAQALLEDKSNLVESREQAEQYAAKVAEARKESMTLVFKGSAALFFYLDDEEVDTYPLEKSQIVVVDGQTYTIAEYKITYVTLEKKLKDYLDEDKSNLVKNDEAALAYIKKQADQRESFMYVIYEAGEPGNLTSQIEAYLEEKGTAYTKVSYSNRVLSNPVMHEGVAYRVVSYTISYVKTRDEAMENAKIQEYLEADPDCLVELPDMEQLEEVVRTYAESHVKEGNFYLILDVKNPGAGFDGTEMNKQASAMIREAAAEKGLKSKIGNNMTNGATIEYLDGYLFAGWMSFEPEEKPAAAQKKILASYPTATPSNAARK